MFFSGDASTRKRVDLGGRSSKERDRQKLLEQTRLERKRRLGLRQQNSAALKIQKFFRGRKAVEFERAKVREQFCSTYGKQCLKVDGSSFRHDSDFLRQLLFFFNAKNSGDFTILVETCRLFQQFVPIHGNIVNLFAGTDCSLNHAIVENRVKRLAFACLQAVHYNRDQLKDQLLMSHDFSSIPAVVLLETVVALINPDLPWVCKVVSSLTQRNTFGLLRDIVLIVEDAKARDAFHSVSPLECVLSLISSHIGQHPCNCSYPDPRWSFCSQLLSIPFFWQHFPYLKQVFSTKGLGNHYIHQMAMYLHGHTNILPNDASRGFPGYACLLGNILEIAGLALSQPDCTFNMAIDFAAVSTFLLEALPPVNSSIAANSTLDESEMAVDDEAIDVLSKDLERQITNAIDPVFLQQLVNVFFKDTSCTDGTHNSEVEAVGAVCTFLHVTFNILPLERIMTGLAYRTELVPILWKFMKLCHERQRWPSLSEQTTHLSGDAPGWLLPLAVFCPVYKYMLMIVDNEEFYDQEKPLSLKDIRALIIILRQALWQLLWVIPGKSSTFQKSTANFSHHKKLSINFLQHKVGIVTSELLTQLQDWNNRRQFTSPTDFHAQEAVDDIFVLQAVIENTRAYEILKQAPFLVPFTSRVKIFTSQLAAVRQRNGHNAAFTRHRFRIRRDHIFEDAFNQMSVLSDEDLKGMIRVTFVNEFGVEEAGIDGGGIFKDFMENITRAAFDVQYGLFKETADHLLYPNPGSGLIHERHLQFFHFLGSVLGKAMFEGILVDIPFATFFLSKLKQKYNYLNDLPSLDPELYRHLLFLKHYKGDISELELYFVIVNNEYGEQTEEELLPGGKEMRVTNENVITFIHLIANHRLNSQIRHQSSHFLRGFQQLIQKDWMDMFNEHELQILISGSLEGMDISDLRANAHYTGGYSEEHGVIQMFWQVLENFSADYQKKFLNSSKTSSDLFQSLFSNSQEISNCLLTRGDQPDTLPFPSCWQLAKDQFVTGCSRGPLLGFKYLEPLFCIQRAGPGDPSEEDLDRLPTSATCMNLLKLPPYRSKEQLEMKLIYAINADAGFDLS